MANDRRRDAYEWEWRDVEYERRRVHARAMARRRGRLRLAALIVGAAAVISSALLAARAVALPAPYARAALACVDGSTTGGVAVMASRSDNEESSLAEGVGDAATWVGGEAIVSSSVMDGALISIATVSLTDVSLAGGRVTAASIELVANAASTRTAQSGGVDVSRIEGLAVDGVAVPIDQLPFTIGGLGTLFALEHREARDGAALEAEVTGLRLHLTRPWKGLPDGADIVVAMAAACADRHSADRLLPQPAPSESNDDSNGPGDDSNGGQSGGASSGGGSSGGESFDDAASGGDGSSSADSFRPGKMPAPRTRSGRLLAFPAAVFPVDGEVWYSDDWGAPRAVGGGHSGNDIFARMGTPVVAVQSGVVNELRFRSLGGNSFRLSNDAGDYFYYAHLLRYAAGIEEGSLVEAGQILGYVGNTGNAIATPPHLHFEIHPGGRAPVDPFPYLELWRGVGATATADAAESQEDSVQEREAGARQVISIEAKRGRHERSVIAAGVPTAPLSGSSGEGGLVPAAVSFGVVGGLVTTAVRRRRAEMYSLTMNTEDLRRAGRAG